MFKNVPETYPLIFIFLLGAAFKNARSLREGMYANITKIITVLNVFDSADFGLEFKILFSCK